MEDYDQDPIIVSLRKAYNIHHALQCGFCTPGMLATSRDIVLRLPNADEDRIRIELAGNICRCTGHLGTLRAVHSVLTDLQQNRSEDHTSELQSRGLPVCRLQPEK